MDIAMINLSQIQEHVQLIIRIVTQMANVGIYLNALQVITTL
jgi:hypothetical protein